MVRVRGFVGYLTGLPLAQGLLQAVGPHVLGRVAQRQLLAHPAGEGVGGGGGGPLLGVLLMPGEGLTDALRMLLYDYDPYNNQCWARWTTWRRDSKTFLI